MMKNKAAHTFERAGLGTAPFKFVGYARKTYQAAHGAPIQPGASCDYCGTGIMDTFQIKSAEGNLFVVGSTCVAKTADVKLKAEVKDTKRAVDRAKREVKRDADRAKRKAQRLARAKDFADSFLAENTELAAAFEVDHPIIKDIKDRLYTWGPISEKQIALVIKIANEPPKVEVDWQEVTEGRRPLTGTVLATKWQDSQYGGSLKMLVHLDGDQKVWGTVPASLFYNEDGTDLELKGKRIQFTATVTQSNDDAKFGFFKRPTKGKVL